MERFDEGLCSKVGKAENTKWRSLRINWIIKKSVQKQCITTKL